MASSWLRFFQDYSRLPIQTFKEADILNASFEYDGNGIRRKAVEGDKITRYYYDGLNVLFEKDVSGFTNKAYTRGLGFPGGIGGLISMKRYEMDDEGLKEKTHYYHYDALGSVVNLSDRKGSLTTDYEYDAFGNGKHGKKWNTYRFSSKEFEDHAGLYFFGARYYDPEIGRWLTPDPLGFIDGIVFAIALAFGLAGKDIASRYLDVLNFKRPDHK
ncbi:MAG: RHS repeat-associated core domain-containing protein [Candidatus Omnitrophica bacterium]|nr:RHS repeat-associated core domain-containing protein [Candidatus Omnitrophota bacterium]